MFLKGKKMEKMEKTTAIAKLLEKLAFQGIEKQSLSRLNLLMDNFNELAKFKERLAVFNTANGLKSLYDNNIDFRELFSEIIEMSKNLISKEDISSLLKEKKEEISDLKKIFSAYAENGYKINNKKFEADNLKLHDNITIKKAIQLKADIVVLKKNHNKARDIIKELEEQALIEAQKKYDL